MTLRDRQPAEDRGPSAFTAPPSRVKKRYLYLNSKTGHPKGAPSSSAQRRPAGACPFSRRIHSSPSMGPRPSQHHLMLYIQPAQGRRVAPASGTCQAWMDAPRGLGTAPGRGHLSPGSSMWH